MPEQVASTEFAQDLDAPSLHGVGSNTTLPTASDCATSSTADPALNPFTSDLVTSSLLRTRTLPESSAASDHQTEVPIAFIQCAPGVDSHSADGERRCPEAMLSPPEGAAEQAPDPSECVGSSFTHPPVQPSAIPCEVTALDNLEEPVDTVASLALSCAHCANRLQNNSSAPRAIPKEESAAAAPLISSGATSDCGTSCTAAPAVNAAVRSLIRHVVGASQILASGIHTRPHSADICKGVSTHHQPCKLPQVVSEGAGECNSQLVKKK